MSPDKKKDLMIVVTGLPLLTALYWLAGTDKPERQIISFLIGYTIMWIVFYAWVAFGDTGGKR